jgi:hypothetical protein
LFSQGRKIIISLLLCDHRGIGGKPFGKLRR